MQYIIIGLLILLLYVIYKQCSVIIDKFIVPVPSTEYDLKGQIDNNGEAEKSFGPPVFLTGEHYEYNCSSPKNTSEDCNTINGGCICGSNCKSDNCVEPRWKWNQRWIERAKLEMKKDEIEIEQQFGPLKPEKCC
jgi:hypothetical protein